MKIIDERETQKSKTKPKKTKKKQWHKKEQAGKMLKWKRES